MKMNRPYRQHAQTVARARNGEVAARCVVEDAADGRTRLLDAVAANLLERWSANPRLPPLVLASRLTDSRTRSSAKTLRRRWRTWATAAPGNSRAALQERLERPARNVRGGGPSCADVAFWTRLAGSEWLHMLTHNADQPAGQMQLGVFALPAATRRMRWVIFKPPRGGSFLPGIRHETAIVPEPVGAGREEALTEFGCPCDSRRATQNFVSARARVE